MSDDKLSHMMSLNRLNKTFSIRPSSEQSCLWWVITKFHKIYSKNQKHKSNLLSEIKKKNAQIQIYKS